MYHSLPRVSGRAAWPLLWSGGERRFANGKARGIAFNVSLFRLTSGGGPAAMGRENVAVVSEKSSKMRLE